MNSAKTQSALKPVFGWGSSLGPAKGGGGKGLDTWYSVAYMSQTRDQQRFTISEVAADDSPQTPYFIRVTTQLQYIEDSEPVV